MEYLKLTCFVVEFLADIVIPSMLGLIIFIDYLLFEKLVHILSSSIITSVVLCLETCLKEFQVVCMMKAGKSRTATNQRQARKEQVYHRVLKNIFFTSLLK